MKTLFHILNCFSFFQNGIFIEYMTYNCVNLWHTICYFETFMYHDCIVRLCIILHDYIIVQYCSLFNYKLWSFKHLNVSLMTFINTYYMFSTLIMIWKVPSCPLRQSTYPCYPWPRQLLTWFISLWICFECFRFSIQGIIQCLSFCLTSFNQHIVSSIHLWLGISSLFFYLSDYYTLWIKIKMSFSVNLMDIILFSIFYSQIKLLWAFLVLTSTFQFCVNTQEWNC